MRLILLSALLLGSAFAMFVDQVGKFDWRKQLVGCPSQVIFSRNKEGADSLILSTREDIIASLSSNTGELGWRKILEHDSESDGPSVRTTTDGENIYAITNGGQVVRAWSSATGEFLFQIPVQNSNSEAAAIAVTDDIVVASTGSKIVVIDKKQAKRVSERLFATSKWVRVAVISGHAYHLSINEGKLEVRSVSASSIDEPKVVQIGKEKAERCHLTSSHVVCINIDSTTNIDPTTLKMSEIKSNLVVKGAIATKIGTAVYSDTTVKVFKGEKLVLTESGNFHAATLAENSNTLVLVSPGNVYGIDLVSGVKKFEKTYDVSDKTNKVDKVWASMTGNDGDFEVVIRTSDCTVQLVVVEGSKKKASVEWTREESLIRIAAVEMVDLPLSESQQMIEDEFEGENGNIISALLHRSVTQVGQLRKWLGRVAHGIVTFVSSLSRRTHGIADVIGALRSATSQSFDEDVFERDYFNLRKVIIVSSLDGVVFGIDSKNGRIIWKISLGPEFAPLSSKLNGRQVPLFVQRTTSNYQLDGRAVVVFQNIATSEGIAVVFNPMHGKIEETKNLGVAVKRVSLLPFVIEKHIQPLLIVSQENGISYLPEIPQNFLESAAPIYLLDVEAANVAKGYQINLAKKQLSVSWSANLGLSSADKIVALRGKSFNQKVHSQGRVLIDRNVQFKYVNPNLAALGTVNENTQSISLTFFDVVTGQVVYSTTVAKASGPLHLVLSEHWIVFSYWSEKSRRTELSVVELYEGDELSQTKKFDSFSPTLNAPQSISSSYIYVQGVEHMAVSETEQGLTTKAILVALPNGGIHEISRKLLDATRPQELTQEMREEGMIGYMPEIGIATEEMINYNQTVHRVNGIKAVPSGLESTSLVLAHGTDIFFTRLSPSGTFDILKDDFDHVLITLVLAALVAGSIVTKKLSRNNALNAQWA